MPIPNLDSDGLLPSAIYECSVDECIARFGEYMQSDCRPKLADKLRRFFVDVERKDRRKGMLRIDVTPKE
jgi:hypothetical protein